MVAKYLISWFLLAIVAVANGVARQGTYGKILPDLAAHQISTLTGIIATGAVGYGLARTWPLESARQAWTIGLFWLLFTVVFELGFGRFVAGHTWQSLFADYNILRGRVWLFFLVWVAFMPYVYFRLVTNAS